jgi:hypothetical protein
MPAAKTTTDHKEIRKWVERHGGRPAHVKQTGRGRNGGILRVDFPGFSGEDTLEPLSWKEWFDAFEKNELAFLYQDSPRSRFSKLIDRESSSAPTRRATAAKRTAKKRTGAARTARTAAKVGTVKRAARKTARRGGVTKRAASTRPATKKKSATARKSARAGTSRR